MYLYVALALGTEKLCVGRSVDRADLDPPGASKFDHDHAKVALESKIIDSLFECSGRTSRNSFPKMKQGKRAMEKVAPPRRSR